MPSRAHPPSFVPSSRRQRVAQRAAIAAIAAGALAAGCSSGASVDATSATSAPPSVSPGTGAATPGTGAPHTHPVVDVQAVDFAFENLPRTIAAGTRLTLTNGATSELHELVAIRLPDDEARSVDELIRLPQPELAAIIGAAPPTTVLLAAPGSPQIAAVGDGTLTEPGRYLVLCSIPTGIDPATYLAAAAQAKGAPPQVPGGPPHFVNGMVADLVVE